MSTVACLVVAVLVLGLIHVMKVQNLSRLSGQSVSVRKGWKGVQRTLSLAAVLAMMLQMVPVNIPPPSETTNSLIPKAPAPLNTTAPYLSKTVSPLDTFSFSNIQPVFADPTAGITLTKSAPVSVNQVWGGDTSIYYAITLTNPSALTITVGSIVTDAIPMSTTWKNKLGNNGPGWLFDATGSNPRYELQQVTNTTTYVGGFQVVVNTPVRDGTVITNTTYCFSGTVDSSFRQFCETTPITTEIWAPDFSLTESWASASGAVCAGQRLTYTITISNPGRVGTTQPFTVTGIITNPLTIYTNTLSSDATSAGNVITWSITSDDLDANGANFITRTFAVSVPISLATGTYLTNTYTITSPEVVPTQASWSSSGVRVGRVTAAFTSTSPVCVGRTMAFTSTGEGATSYVWNFGDGITQTTTSTVVSHTYSSAVNFTVVLTATGACGSAVTQTTVTVNSLPTVSGFTSNSPVCLGQTAVFTWFPSGVSSLLWNFGDGDTESSINMPQTHIYTATGTYTVTLTVTNTAGCSNSYTTTFSVEDTYASFTPSIPLSICVGAAVQFTDTSTSTCCLPLTRTWNFGDGTPTSTITSPIHTFNTPGTFTVILTSTNSLGCSDVATNTVFVDGIAADFQPSTPLSICVGSTVYFTDTSVTSGTIASRLWQFGGTTPVTATTQTVSRTYNTAGTFAVTLTVTNSTGCSDVATGTITVNPLPTAGFSRTPSSSVCANQVITFTNTSTNATTYQWNFGDGSPVTTTISPTHAYTASGSYTVWLTATNACGSNVTSDTVTVNPLPTAGFSRNPGGLVCTSQVITFTDTSSGSPTSWLWSFGDSITSTQQHPTHTYAITGTFTVWLTATNACGSGVTSDTIPVGLSPSASFTATTPVCLGQAMSFTNTGSVGTYLWSFGDGITSTLQNPSHTYATTGTFTVWLTTTNACGSGVTSGTVTVNPLPTVSFTSNSPVNLGQTMYFTNTGSTSTYQWNLGDNSPIQTTRDVTHTYGSIGSYVVWLTTTLGTGCWDTYSATVMVTGTTGCEDAYEPDNSWSDAITVTPPSTTRHNFDYAGDTDWVVFSGTAGITYTIETMNLAVSGTQRVDTKLFFYWWNGSNLVQLAFNDDGGDELWASKIVWPITTTGWYYVNVGHVVGSHSFAGCGAYYDLSISGPPTYLPIILKNHPPPPPTPTPSSPTPTPGPCYPLVERTILVGNEPCGVAYNGDDNRIYVANYGDGTVSVINGATYGVTTTSGVAGAHGVAYDNTHHLVYVTQRDSARLAVIDASTSTISRTISVGNQPRGVAYNPTSHKIYVANYASDTVTIIDADTMSVLATVPTGDEPAHVTVNSNPISNKVYVSNHGSGTVTVIHGTTNGVVATVSLGSSGPYGIAADTQRNLIYVVSIDVPGLKAPNLVTVDGATDQVKSDMWGRVNIHKSDDSLVPLRVIAVHPGLGSSGHLYVTSSSGDRAGDGSYGTDQLLMMRKGWPEGFNKPNPLNVGGRPEEGVAVDLANNRVFVTARWANQLTVIQDTSDHGQLCVETFALDGYVIEPVQ